MDPLRLPQNTFRRFYRGGTGIAEFRGVPLSDPCRPEDWVGSTTSTFGCDGPGLSRLEDGRLLRDAIAEDPVGFLGPAHVDRFGADPALLVKLLDPDQRLPVHCHPDRAFAGKHLSLRYGKTEAWIVVATRASEPRVYLGFREPMEPEKLATLVAEQRTDALLASVNQLPVQAGDAILVPAGIPHAVGPGILIVELQEPTDLSVLMEWKGLEIDGSRDGHLGLGFERALQSVDRSAWDSSRLRGLYGNTGGGNILPKEADPFFRAQMIAGPATLEPQFSILVIVEGSGELASESGAATPVSRGQTFLIPYAAGECLISGSARIIRCLPPVAAAASLV